LNITEVSSSLHHSFSKENLKTVKKLFQLAKIAI
jgi:hypothetical protein